VQIYTCAAAGPKFEWVFKGPEVNLFDAENRQVGLQFGGPTWKLDDGSAVVGEVAVKIDAPQPGAIQWLVLRAKSHATVAGLLLTGVALLWRGLSRKTKDAAGDDGSK